MAVQQPGFSTGFIVAGADLSAAQFKFVKLNSSGEAVVCDDATDIPVGVLQNKPTSGQACNIMHVGLSKVQGDANLAPGDQIGTSADGQADAKTAGTDTTEYVVGQVVRDNTVAAGLVSALINCLNPHRAA